MDKEGSDLIGETIIITNARNRVTAQYALDVLFNENKIAGRVNARYPDEFYYLVPNTRWLVLEAEETNYNDCLITLADFTNPMNTMKIDYEELARSARILG